MYREIFADMHTAVSAFLKISKNEKYAYLLESMEGGEKWARYTFMGAGPEMVIATSGKKGVRISKGKKTPFTVEKDPLDEIKKALARFKPVAFEGLPPFVGGAVGAIGYDAVRFFEKLPDNKKPDAGFPDAVFMLTDTLLVIDHLKQTIKIIVNAHVEGDPKKVYGRAVKKIDAIMKKLGRPLAPQKRSAKKGEVKSRSDTAEAEYLKSVQRCKHYIKEGDIFQVVLAQKVGIDLDVPAFDVYRALRVVNPSPYMYYMRLGDWEVVGASPETLCKVQDGRVTVRPIAGTRPRGKSELEDKLLEKELMADAKEQAEHIMLVDLGRNDLGRICKSGTVAVTSLKKVERYSHVMHIVSNVEGELHPDRDAFDVIRATFPAGTLSGAPKIRAMEIIEELEPSRRGLYGGAVGYLAFNGNMDTAIAIRTLAVKNKKAYLGVGAGIVADSDPKSEYQECINKGKALLRAVELARAGLL